MWTPRGFSEYHALFKQSVIDQVKRAKAELEDDKFKVYDNYEGHFNLGGVEERKYDRCFMIEVQPVIAADCGVYTCQDKAYSRAGFLGSIKDISFKELWFSQEMQKRIREFEVRKNCCHHCSKDLRNINIQQMIQDLDNLDKYKPASERHKNFI
jgi:hypothetical protein